MDKIITVFSLVWVISLCGITVAQDRGWAASIAWSRDGELVAIGSNTGVWFFDPDFNEKGYVATPKMGGYPPTTMDWNAASDLVAISGAGFRNDPVLVVDVNAQEVVSAIKDRRVTSTVRWHPKEDFILAGSSHGTTYVWDALTGVELFLFQETLSERYNIQNYIQAVCWLSDSAIASLGAYETYIVDVEKDKTLESTITSQVGMADCGRDGNILIISSTGGVYHLVVGKPEEIPALNDISRTGPAAGVDATWSPDGIRIVINGFSCIVHVYESDGRNWELSARLQGSYSREFTESSYQDSIAWHPDGSRFAVVGQFDIRMWDAETYKLLHTFDGFEVGYHETLKSSIGLSEEERKKLMDAKNVKCP